MKLRVVLEPSDEGGFTVYVPSLRGCISEGETEEEAIANIREVPGLLSSSCSWRKHARRELCEEETQE